MEWRVGMGKMEKEGGRVGVRGERNGENGKSRGWLEGLGR